MCISLTYTLFLKEFWSIWIRLLVQTSTKMFSLIFLFFSKLNAFFSDHYQIIYRYLLQKTYSTFQVFQVEIRCLHDQCKSKSTAQKMKFSIKDLWPNPQETDESVTFSEEILNRKLHFLYSKVCWLIITAFKYPATLKWYKLGFSKLSFWPKFMFFHRKKSFKKRCFLSLYDFFYIFLFFCA